MTGEGIDDLRDGIMETLFEKMVPIRVRLPYAEGALIALFHDQGLVEFIENGRSSVMMAGTIPIRFVTAFQPFFIDENDNGENDIPEYTEE